MIFSVPLSDFGAGVLAAAAFLSVDEAAFFSGSFLGLNMPPNQTTPLHLAAGLPSGSSLSAATTVAMLRPVSKPAVAAQILRPRMPSSRNTPDCQPAPGGRLVAPDRF